MRDIKSSLAPLSVCVCRYDSGEFERLSSSNQDRTTSEVLVETDVDDGDEEKEKSDRQKKVANDSESEKLKKMTMLPQTRRSTTG